MIPVALNIPTDFSFSPFIEALS